MPATAKKKARSTPAAKKTAAAKPEVAAKPAAKPAAKAKAASVKAPKAAARAEPKAAPVAAARAEATATTLRFAEDWSVSVSGPITAGSKLAVDYSLERARAHGGRAGAQGQGTWGVTAFALFVPGGESAEVTVIRATASQAKATPAELPVPHGAQEVELWFRNWTENDEAGAVWDSNFGKNYRFPVTA